MLPILMLKPNLRRLLKASVQEIEAGCLASKTVIGQIINVMSDSILCGLSLQVVCILSQ